MRKGEFALRGIEIGVESGAEECSIGRWWRRKGERAIEKEWEIEKKGYNLFIDSSPYFVSTLIVNDNIHSPHSPLPLSSSAILSTSEYPQK